MQLRSVLVAGLACASGVAAADSTVNVTLTPEGKAYAAAHQQTEADLQAELKKDIDDAYQTANLPGFLRAFTDATAFSQRGIGVDYASVPQSYVFGIAGNVAAASDSVLAKSDRPTAGAAVNLGLMFGANLGGMDLPRWTVFANGFYQNGSTGAATNELSGSITSVGAHLQYRLIEPERTGGTATALRWLGLDLTGGIEYTRWSLAGANFHNTFKLADGDTLDLAAAGNFALKTNAVTIPVEVTTGLRLALIASIFVGVGLDLTYGKSDVDGNLTGDLVAKPTAQDAGTKIGTVAMTASGSNTGSPAEPRALAGVQLNLWKLKLFVQANVSAVPAASVAFGLKIVF